MTFLSGYISAQSLSLGFWKITHGYSDGMVETVRGKKKKMQVYNEGFFAFLCSGVRGFTYRCVVKTPKKEICR